MLEVPIHIEKVSLKMVEVLANIGKTTFYESFGADNNEEDINTYINERFSSEQILKELKNPNSQFFFGKADHKIVGYLKVNTGDAQTEKVQGRSLEIERIYVIKNYQDKKIGAQLLQYSLELAKRLQVEFIWLGVWEKNSRAIQFYQKHGFKEFSKHPYAVGADIQLDIMMKKNI